MRILLDTHDLVALFDRGTPCSVDDFRGFLVSGDHQLVVCPILVKEVCAPLVEVAGKSTVFNLLGQLETLPICYLSDARIALEELEEAATAHVESREPHRPEAALFFDRLDKTTTLRGETGSERYLRYSLPEIVWDLWVSEPGFFKPFRAQGDSFRDAVQTRRSRGRLPLREEFMTFVEGLAQVYDSKLRIFGHRLELQVDDFRFFALWLWEKPGRCPGIRTHFEVRNQLMLNRSDSVKHSDVLDLSLTQALGYVDVATVDRRTQAYLISATRQFPNGVICPVYRSLTALLEAL